MRGLKDSFEMRYRDACGAQRVGRNLMIGHFMERNGWFLFRYIRPAMQTPLFQNNAWWRTIQSAIDA